MMLYLSRITTLVLFVLAISGLSACQFIFGGRDYKSKHNKAAVGNNVENGPAAGTLVLGNSLVSELHGELVTAGLTEDEAGIISSSAQVTMQAEAGRIAVGLQLSDNQAEALQYLSPAVIQGAMAALVHVPSLANDPAKRQIITQVVMGASFASLKDRTGGLSEEGIHELAAKMIQGAMRKLDEAGLGNQHAGAGSAAITAGAVGALARAGFGGEQASSVATLVVTVAVEDLGQLAWQANEAAEFARSVGQATAGAVAELDKLGLAVSAQRSLVGSLTAAAMQSLGTLKKDVTRVDVGLEASVKAIASQSVAALQHNKQLQADQLAPTLSAMTGAMASSLSKAGFVPDQIAKGAASVSAGAVAGVTAGQISAQDLQSKGLAKELIGGVVAHLPTGSMTSSERAAALADIVGGAVAALGESAVKDATTKESLVGQLVAGSLTQIKASGLSEQGSIELAVESANKGAVKALVAAGVGEERLSKLAANVAETSIKTIVNEKLASNGEDFKVITAGVTRGLMTGMGQLQAAGTVSATTVRSGVNEAISRTIDTIYQVKDNPIVGLGSSELADLSADLAGQALQGLASGGVPPTSLATLQSDVNQEVVADLRSLGVSETKLAGVSSTIDTKGETATKLATDLQAGASRFALCRDAYSDSFSDTQVLAAVKDVALPLYCRVAVGELCPKSRADASLKVEWIRALSMKFSDATAPEACELRRQSIQVIAPAAFALTTTERYRKAGSVLRWQSSAGAQEYRVRLTSDRTGTSLALEKGLGAVNEVQLPTLLRDGDYYVWIDAVNAYNQKTAANGSPLLITIDTTEPTAPASLDDGSCGFTSVPMTWAAATDAGSNVARYELALGAAVGGTELLNWQDAGTGTSSVLNLAGLSLTVGATYFAQVRAIDMTGNVGPAKQGDGFVYQRWCQQAYFKAPNNASGVGLSDIFGHTVSLEGNTLAIGAQYEDSAQTTITNGTQVATDQDKFNAGAAFVFVRSGTTWDQQAYIKPANTAAFIQGANSPIGGGGVQFGSFVELRGDTLAVAAVGEDGSDSTITNSSTLAGPQDATFSGSGAVYIFRRNAASWAQESYLKAPNRRASHSFGASLALGSDVLAVGAPHENGVDTTITNGSGAGGGSATQAGAVYIFKRSGTQWTQTAYIKPSNARANSTFGDVVSMDGDTLAVGSPFEDSATSAIAYGTFAPTDSSSTSGLNSGAAYIFQESGGVWTQQAYLKAGKTQASLKFGSQVGLSGDTLAVAAPGDSSNQMTITNGTSISTNTDATASGAAFVYTRVGTTWSQQAYIKPSNTKANQEFGNGGFILTGNRLFVSAFMDDTTQTTISFGGSSSTVGGAVKTGAVYAFSRTGSTWSEEAYIKPSNARARIQFGMSIDVDGDTLVVGADGENSSQAGITYGTSSATDNDAPGSGAVYIFKRQ